MRRGARWAAAAGSVVAMFAGLAPGSALALVRVTVKTGAAPVELACAPDSLRTSRMPLSDASPVPTIPVRIAFWGDSHTASGAFVDAALREWGIAPAAVRPSYIAASLATKGVRLPLRSWCASPAWRTRFAYQAESRMSPDFGPGLAVMEAETQDAALAWDFRWPSPSTTVQAVTIHLGPREPGRSLLLAISADDGPERIVPVPSAVAEEIQVQGDAPFSVLRLRVVAGRAVIAGLEPVYETASPVVVDVFAIPGATAQGWQGVSQAPQRLYDLVVLAFGTNEAAAPAFRAGTYADSLRRSVARWRQAYPQARCVLVTPPDRGAAQASQQQSRRHAEVAVIQRVVSHSFGCALWDWQGWMRSTGRSVLLQGDQTHLSAPGYEASGRAFAMAVPLGGR